MKKKTSNLIKFVMILTVVITTFTTVSFAAWWGTPGYEWAKSKGLTTMANTTALNNKVSHDDFYTVLLRYLSYKGVMPKDSVRQRVGEFNSKNKALEGFVREIDAYISKESLTINEYRSLATYIEHLKGVITDNEIYLTRDNLKNFRLYLTIAKYQGAMLVGDSDYRALVTSNRAPTAAHNIGAVKHKGLITYKIKPYFDDISRKEFLLLMFSLLSEQNVSDEDIIKQFEESGVLIGYNDDMMLEQDLTYAEMFTFLRRFETFDFNPVIEEDGDGSTSEDGVIEYK